MTTATVTTATTCRRRTMPAGLDIGTARLPADVAAAEALLALQLRWVAVASPRPTSVADEVAQLRRGEGDVRLLLARRGGRPVGVCRVRYGRRGPGGRSAQVTHLYVMPEARGAGVGEALVTQAGVLAWWFGSRELRAVTTSWPGEAVVLLERVGMRRRAEGVLVMGVEPPVTAEP